MGVVNTKIDPAGVRNGGARFIDPQVLTRIGNLDLLARIVVDGFIAGLHRTLFLGVSTEFAEHRAYSPGDDVRRIDWRVFARTDRFYVKAYEAETNADLVVALDVSKSMDFSSGEPDSVTKLDYARFVAASLAHLAGRQRDRIGLSTFDVGLVQMIPPSGRHRDRVLRTLETISVGNGSDIGKALERLGDGLHRRGIVVVISDFYSPAEDIISALDGLRVRGHDVIAIHILDPMELDLRRHLGERSALTNAEALQDMETTERIPMVPGQQQTRYRRLVQEHINALRHASGGRGVDYACFDTSQPLDHILFRYLSERARLAHVR